MDALDLAAQHARTFLDGLQERPVRAEATYAELVDRLGGPLPESGLPAPAVIDELVRDADPGLVATAGPRYFGFVTGGALPAAVGADWLASAWDQNAALSVMSPAAAALETVSASWLLELLGLPHTASVGFATGGQAANLTCLLAARHAVLRDHGWDVEADGLQGAPHIRVLAGEHVHVAALAALRYTGLGSRPQLIATDDQGRMDAGALESALAAAGGPAIVLAQAGEVNSGAFDPLGEIVAACRAHGAWCHVDGAFGLWAAAAPSLRHLAAGHDGADSWAVDGHKWLNVPYDSGYAIVADSTVHQAALGASAAYLMTGGTERQGFMFVPEASRRARGVATYAALRALGRDGVADLVERCCALARRIANHLREVDGIEILNDVVLNQVLVRVGDDDARTDAAIAAIQSDGTCWLGGTTFRGRRAMRISVSSHATTEADADRSAEAIAAATTGQA